MATRIRVRQVYFHKRLQDQDYDVIDLREYRIYDDVNGTRPCTARESENGRLVSQLDEISADYIPTLERRVRIIRRLSIFL